ncbi:HNH endonuclease [Kineothrix alysoides]|uniref:HNH endonuclease n=1 Tax=Kineothrix alysoides TaxID=1469948 RepID=A0A4R1R6N0_9FIRM|nr:HNH endonuclease domain-containing protein [Kineothrix alysoides]TCL61236.1 HNH endonuclease [Kineothrix alysoides]
MAQLDTEKIGYQLNMDGKYYNSLDIEAFSHMMKNPSYCYKFYWLEAVVSLISEDIKETNFNEIIDEMIANAWYSVLEFHIHLSGIIDGQVKDGLERAVLTLQELSGLPGNASKVEIKNKIKEYDKELKTYKEQLTNMVPYRALAGFFDKCEERADWESARRMVAYIERVNQVTLLPYTLGTGSKLKKEVYFNEFWIKMIQDHTVSILGWIQYEKVKWLQNNNPEVPGLVYKLAPMDEKMRKLNNVRKLWEVVLDNRPIVDVFENLPIVKGNYDVDHFIPWSFVMNDELWNLMPMDSSLNSSKSNKLPKWDPFFKRFAGNQFILYGMIHDDRKPEFRRKYEACYRDNLHSIWANQELYRKGNSEEEFYNILEKNMQPVYDSARRQGYQIW